MNRPRIEFGELEVCCCGGKKGEPQEMIKVSLVVVTRVFQWDQEDQSLPKLVGADQA